MQHTFIYSLVLCNLYIYHFKEVEKSFEVVPQDSTSDHICMPHWEPIYPLLRLVPLYPFG